ncbi:MAG: thermonuclease family protein [Candidatus Bathyarchaeota archaeon]
MIRVDDGATIIIRPNTVLKLAGVTLPEIDTHEAAEAHKKLKSLVLGKKVEFETIRWDRLGRSLAMVRVDGVNVNEEIIRFLGAFVE